MLEIYLAYVQTYSYRQTKSHLHICDLVWLYHRIDLMCGISAIFSLTYWKTVILYCLYLICYWCTNSFKLSFLIWLSYCFIKYYCALNGENFKFSPFSMAFIIFLKGQFKWDFFPRDTNYLTMLLLLPLW